MGVAAKDWPFRTGSDLEHPDEDADLVGLVLRRRQRVAALRERHGRRELAHEARQAGAGERLGKGVGDARRRRRVRRRRQHVDVAVAQRVNDLRVRRIVSILRCFFVFHSTYPAFKKRLHSWSISMIVRWISNSLITTVPRIKFEYR